jgi:glucans biosynthesis protein
MLDRRSLLKVAIATQMFGGSVLAGRSALAAPPPGLRYGDASPFSYDWLKSRARELASAPYQQPPRPDPAIVESIDYDAHGKLKYKPEDALYGDGQPGAYPVTFQHVGRFFPKTVKMHAVDPAAGTAREIQYDPQYFTVGPDSPAAKLAPEPSAFAGFWIQEAKDGKADWKTLRPAQRPQPQRRLPFPDAAHRRRGDGHRHHAVPAPAGRPPRPRAADLDVLVLRDGEADRDRLAARGA